MAWDLSSEAAVLLAGMAGTIGTVWVSLANNRTQLKQAEAARNANEKADERRHERELAATAVDEARAAREAVAARCAAFAAAMHVWAAELRMQRDPALRHEAVRTRMDEAARCLAELEVRGPQGVVTPAQAWFEALDDSVDFGDVELREFAQHRQAFVDHVRYELDH